MMNQSHAFLKMRDNDVEKPYGCMFRHSKSLQKTHTNKLVLNAAAPMAVVLYTPQSSWCCRGVKGIKHRRIVVNNGTYASVERQFLDAISCKLHPSLK